MKVESKIILAVQSIKVKKAIRYTNVNLLPPIVLPSNNTDRKSGTIKIYFDIIKYG
jgi:hypothetical protein